MKSNYILLLAVLLVSLVLMSGCVQQNTTPSRTDQEQTKQTQSTSEVLTEESVSIKTHDVIVDWDELISSSKEDWFLVHINTTFENTGKKTIEIFYDNFKLEDNEKRQFSYKDSFYGTQYAEVSLSLEPTETNNKIISFELPKISLKNPLKLIYNDKIVNDLYFRYVNENSYSIQPPDEWSVEGKGQFKGATEHNLAPSIMIQTAFVINKSLDTIADELKKEFSSFENFKIISEKDIELFDKSAKEIIFTSTIGKEDINVYIKSKMIVIYSGNEFFGHGLVIIFATEKIEYNNYLLIFDKSLQTLKILN